MYQRKDTAMIMQISYKGNHIQKRVQNAIMKKNGESKMTFENAKKLHNGDEVSVKVTGEIVTVLQTYQLEDKKHIAIECDNGYTYYNDEVR